MKLRLRPQAKKEPAWVHEVTEGAAIAHCDNLEFMRLIPSGSIDLIVSSPPYPGLRGAKGQSVKEWEIEMLPRFSQIVRILNPVTGVLVLNVQFPRTAAGEVDLRLYKLPAKINAYVKLLDALTGGYKTLDNDDALRVEEIYIWDKVNAVPAGDMNRHDIPGWEPVFVLTRSADYFFSPQRKPYADNTIVRFKHGDGRGDGVGQVYNSGGPSTPHPDGARLNNVLRISSSGGVKRPRAIGGSFPISFADRFIAQYAAPDAVIFDPWAGVGTAVLQALLAGHSAFGCDTDIRAVADGNEWIRSTLANGVQAELF